MAITIVYEVYGPDGAYLAEYTFLSDALDHKRRVRGSIKTVRRTGSVKS